MTEELAKLIFELQNAATVFESIQVPENENAHRAVMFNASHAKLLRRAAEALKDE